MRDPYAVLGVRRNAGADEIKSAWRNVAKAVHPDHNRDDPNAAARFAEAGRAYELLKDPKLRNRYDNARREADLRRMEEMKRKQEPPRELDPETAEDMISRIFGTEPRAQAKPQPTAKPQPQPEAKAEPKPEPKVEPTVAPEAAEPPPEGEERYGPFGILPRAAAPAAELVSAIVRRIRRTQKPTDKVPDIFSEVTVSIADIFRREKPTATLPDGQTIKVVLPLGTVDGSVIRMKEFGYRLNGMIRGDLVVHVRIAADDTFRPDGIDLHTTLPINIQDAVLGCEAKVDTPTGTTTVTVPAWSGSDQTIRIEGQGLPDADGGRGALVVELRLMLWAKPDEKITDLMRARRDGLVL